MTQPTPQHDVQQIAAPAGKPGSRSARAALLEFSLLRSLIHDALADPSSPDLEVIAAQVDAGLSDAQRVAWFRVLLPRFVGDLNRQNRRVPPSAPAPVPVPAPDGRRYASPRRAATYNWWETQLRVSYSVAGRDVFLKDMTVEDCHAVSVHRHGEADKNRTVGVRFDNLVTEMIKAGVATVGALPEEAARAAWGEAA